MPLSNFELRDDAHQFRPGVLIVCVDSANDREHVFVVITREAIADYFRRPDLTAEQCDSVAHWEGDSVDPGEATRSLWRA